MPPGITAQAFLLGNPPKTCPMTGMRLALIQSLGPYTTSNLRVNLGHGRSGCSGAGKKTVVHRTDGNGSGEQEVNGLWCWVLEVASRYPTGGTAVPGGSLLLSKPEERACEIPSGKRHILKGASVHQKVVTMSVTPFTHQHHIFSIYR